MKKFRLIFLWIIAALCLVGCGGEPEVTTETESTEAVVSESDAAAPTAEEKDFSGGSFAIYFFDQTTPNMIQGISGIFERNPLISKEI